MPNSVAQTAQLSCPNCARDFEAQIWLIVDAAEFERVPGLTVLNPVF